MYIFSFRSYEKLGLTLIYHGIKKKDVPRKVIPKTDATYFSFEKCCLGFIDSLRFFNSSLDGLVETLKQEDYKVTKNFAYTRKLLSEKLADPYEHFITLHDH